MKALAIALAAGATSLAATGTTWSGTHSAAACGTSKLAGATIVTHCGPARATFTFGGKTYRVSGGKCSLEKGYGVTAWSLNVGRQTLPPAKPKFADFHATFVGKPKAGTYSTGEYTLSFAVPGKEAWSSAPGLPSKVKVTVGAKSGTFAARFYTGSQSAAKPGSGAWTC